MRMVTVPNQSAVAKAFLEFDNNDRVKPSAYYERVAEVMKELVQFTLPLRDVSPYLVDRYSERKESVEDLSKRVKLSSIQRIPHAISHQRSAPLDVGDKPAISAVESGCRPNRSR
jgi:hypothetical protein